LNGNATCGPSFCSMIGKTTCGGNSEFNTNIIAIIDYMLSRYLSNWSINSKNVLSYRSESNSNTKQTDETNQL